MWKQRDADKNGDEKGGRERDKGREREKHIKGREREREVKRIKSIRNKYKG